VIRLNLLPVRELNAESDRRRDLTVAGISLAVTALILLGIYLYQSAQLSQLAIELPSIRKEVEVLNGKVKELGNLEAKIKELRSKHKVIEDLRGQKMGPSLWLIELKQNGGSLIINGLAMDNQSVAEFIKSLSRSGHFRNVELIETTQADPKTGPYKKFSIQSAISYRRPATPVGASAPTQTEPKGNKS
jgi:type IV pilus assembly protein PilN